MLNPKFIRLNDLKAIPHRCIVCSFPCSHPSATLFFIVLCFRSIRYKIKKPLGASARHPPGIGGCVPRPSFDSNNMQHQATQFLKGRTRYKHCLTLDAKPCPISTNGIMSQNHNLGIHCIVSSTFAIKQGQLVWLSYCRCPRLILHSIPLPRNSDTIPNPSLDRSSCLKKSSWLLVSCSCCWRCSRTRRRWGSKLNIHGRGLQGKPDGCGACGNQCREDEWGWRGGTLREKKRCLRKANTEKVGNVHSRPAHMQARLHCGEEAGRKQRGVCEGRISSALLL